MSRIGTRRISPDTDERLEIRGLRLSRGERHKTRLFVLELVDGSKLEIPVVILRGARPGPVFYLGSAFHGDEVNGVEIVSKFARSIDLRDFHGTMIVVPVQNPHALQSQHRYAVGHLLRSPLDQNPADPWVCFPGKSDGHIASQIANTLFTELMQHADYFIDVHTPTTGGRYAPFAFLPPSNAGPATLEARKLAGNFGADFILAAEEGVYVQEESPHVVLARRGVVSLGLEIGEGGKLDSQVTTRGIRGLRNIVTALGMLDGVIEDFGAKVTIRSMRIARSTRGGLLHLGVKLGDSVRKGQAVATVTDLFGEIVEEIVAPCDGPIVRISTFPAVSAGERIVQIGE